MFVRNLFGGLYVNVNIVCVLPFLLQSLIILHLLVHKSAIFHHPAATTHSDLKAANI